jgi:hypothetical protein
MEARLVQLEQLIAKMNLGTAKDLILAASLKEWNGTKSGETIYEFLEQLEQFGKIRQWTDSNLVNITLSKLSGEASIFVKGLSEIEVRGISYEQLKQKYYTLLHAAKEEKSEGPKRFLDRCRVLRSKTNKASSDLVEQRILREEAGRRLLSAFLRSMQ